MTPRDHFQLLADYNKWMNGRIYATASEYTEAELAEARGAFFSSIIGTLNHILVGDTIWLKRFANHPAKLASLDYVRGIQSPDALDALLYTVFDDLHAERKKMDEIIVQFANELTDADLSTNLKYENTKGQPFERNFGFLVQHFFNHQTHHRGQLTTLFSQSGKDVGVTDLLARIPA